jgi:hypothetical protein
MTGNVNIIGGVESNGIAGEHWQNRAGKQGGVSTLGSTRQERTLGESDACGNCDPWPPTGRSGRGSEPADSLLGRTIPNRLRIGAFLGTRGPFYYTLLSKAYPY